MIISSQFPKPFSFVVFKVKPLKGVVTKKVTKSLMQLLTLQQTNAIVQAQDVTNNVTTNQGGNLKCRK